MDPDRAAYPDPVLIGGREPAQVAVVDVLVTVEDLDDEAGYAGALEAAGFPRRVREPGHADRELYAVTKRELARREWADTNDDADAKSDVIAAILVRARAG